jgi:hypothetical protein
LQHGGSRRDVQRMIEYESHDFQYIHCSNAAIYLDMKQKIDHVWPIGSENKREVEKIFVWIRGVLCVVFQMAFDTSQHGVAALLLRRARTAFDIKDVESLDGLWYVSPEDMQELQEDAAVFQRGA